MNFVKDPRRTPLDPYSVHELWQQLFTMITQVKGDADGAAAQDGAKPRCEGGAKAKTVEAKAKAESETAQPVVPAPEGDQYDGALLGRFVLDDELAPARAGWAAIVESDLKGTRCWDEAAMFTVQGIYAQFNNVLNSFVDDPTTHLGEEFARHKVRLRAEQGEPINIIIALAFVKGAIHQFWQVHMRFQTNVR